MFPYNTITFLPFSQKRQKLTEATEELRDHLLEKLCQYDFSITQQDMLAARQVGTGGWFLRDERFECWLTRARTVLFCPGIPGAGKSVLALIKPPNSQPGAGYAVAFVYCNYKELGLNLLTLLGNIIGQILSQVSDIQQIALNKLERFLPLMRAGQEEAYKSAFRSVSECFSRTFIIVDALDEFSEGDTDRERFIRILRSFCSVADVSILVTSRPIAAIEALFENDTRIEISASEADLAAFIKERLSNSSRRLQRLTKDNETLQEQILQKVTKSAKGMFLLAKLQMDSLSNKHNIKDLRLALENLPQKLDGIYNVEALARIHRQEEDDRDLAISILSWMTFALRPLQISELQYALALSPGDRELDREALIDETDLISVCAGLI
ncbi:hypothetical protein BJ508DRAFT_213418, partial [Ascobolus immersus RN42]